MTDVEDLLRQMFRGQESQAGSAAGLATGARRLVRDRRRRRLAVAGSLVSVCAVLAGVLALRPDRAGQPVAGGTPTSWRIESSLGVEVSVPADWTVNEAGCNRNAEADTVVRAAGVQLACYLAEPATKQMVVVGAHRLMELPGVRPDPTGDRGELRLPDGRFAAWVYFPSLDVTVTIRTRDANLTRRILASVHPVDVDSRGCSTNRPAIDWPAPHKPVQPVRVVPAGLRDAALCYYGDGAIYTGVLQTSVLVSGSALDELVRAVNSTPPGAAAVVKGCGAASEPNALLYFHYPARRTVLVQVTFSGCVGRALVDGIGQSTPTVSLVQALGRMLSTGYGYSSDLPR